MAKKHKDSGGGGGGHDGGGSMRWLLTYADMITLLVAFFVMLYSLSILDLKKFQAVAGALRMNFGGTEKTMPEGGKGVLMPGPADGTKIAIVAGSGVAQMSAVAANIKKLIERAGLQGSLSVIPSERGVTVRFAAEGIMFPPGSAELQPSVHPILKQVAEVIAGTDYAVRVEGHTCSLPMSSARFPSNWELSSARASAVVRYLISLGLPPQRLSAVGFADAHPIAPQDNEADRRRNRRVDIVITESPEAKLLKDILNP
jgi:chemotaxis protein MotB